MNRAFFASAAILSIMLSIGVAAQNKPVPPSPRATPPPRPQPNPGQQQAVACPQIQVQGPGTGRIFRDGEKVNFSFRLNNPAKDAIPTIAWTTSAGTIITGHGTQAITLDTTDAGHAKEITVDVWVGGFAPECMIQGKSTIRVVAPAQKADEFSEYPPPHEKERLEHIANYLSTATDTVYIIGYAGRNNVRNYAIQGVQHIRAKLIEAGVPAGRVGTMNGGFREQPVFELWLVPQGALVPRPAPTINPREIVYPNNRPVSTTPARRP